MIEAERPRSLAIHLECAEVRRQTSASIGTSAPATGCRRLLTIVPDHGLVFSVQLRRSTSWRGMRISISNSAGSIRKQVVVAGDERVGVGRGRERGVEVQDWRRVGERSDRHGWPRTRSVLRRRSRAGDAIGSHLERGGHGRDS
jgi:hypothetical protein